MLFSIYYLLYQREGLHVLDKCSAITELLAPEVLFHSLFIATKMNSMQKQGDDEIQYIFKVWTYSVVINKTVNIQTSLPWKGYHGYYKYKPSHRKYIDYVSIYVFKNSVLMKNILVFRQGFISFSVQFIFCCSNNIRD